MAEDLQKRFLRRGMSKREVRALLGEPDNSRYDESSGLADHYLMAATGKGVGGGQKGPLFLRRLFHSQSLFVAHIRSPVRAHLPRGARTPPGRLSPLQVPCM
jgi:hypothetical protein